MNRTYISGKIGDLPFPEVQLKFSQASEAICQKGDIPVSPLFNGLPTESEWHVHMLADLQMLTTCDEIALLPDWIASPGAMIEKAFAERMGLKVTYL
jgi:hypothetical protein